MFVKDTLIEYANGITAYVSDVLEDGYVVYALLMDSDGKFAAAYNFNGEEDFGFVIDDEHTWRLHKWQALNDIAQGMREMAAT
jgi:hypothetical protein